MEQLAGGESFYIVLGDFLDEFYRVDGTARTAMLADAPSTAARVPREHAALLAASAHKLANDYGLPVPKWAMDKKYRLTDKPYFDCNATGNLRLLFMYKSPTEFKYRNLFVDENFLMRDNNVENADFMPRSNLKISTITPEYQLATRLISFRATGQDYGDIKFLLHKLNIRTFEEAESIIKRFFPLSRVLPKTGYVIENFLEELGGEVN